MDFSVNWSPEAVEDIEEIAAFIFKDSPLYAHKVVEQFVAAARTLRHFPLRGRPVPELHATHRELFIYSYRMIYRVEDQGVLIVSVIHGRRLLESVERLQVKKPE